MKGNSGSGLCYFYENKYVLFRFKEQMFISISFEDKMQFSSLWGRFVFLPLASLFGGMCGFNTEELFVTEQSLKGGDWHCVIE